MIGKDSAYTRAGYKDTLVSELALMKPIIQSLLNLMILFMLLLMMAKIKS